MTCRLNCLDGSVNLGDTSNADHVEPVLFGNHGHDGHPADSAITLADSQCKRFEILGLGVRQVASAGPEADLIQSSAASLGSSDGRTGPRVLFPQWCHHHDGGSDHDLVAQGIELGRPALVCGSFGVLLGIVICHHAYMSLELITSDGPSEQWSAIQSSDVLTGFARLFGLVARLACSDLIAHASAATEVCEAGNSLP